MKGDRMNTIEAHDLRKSYGDVEAVRGVSFEVAHGEVFVLLGPNGAGKTTTTEILEGYRARSGGDVRVLGFDPEQGGRAFHERIGIVLQQTGVEQYLTVGEVLAMYGSYYPPSSSDWSGSRASSTRASTSCPAGSAAGSTSPWRSSAIPTCSSSTSRRPASTPPPAGGRGRRSRGSAGSARPSC
jgi:hypothetical protein